MDQHQGVHAVIATRRHRHPLPQLVATSAHESELPLPAEIQGALDSSSALLNRDLALGAGVGFGVVHQLMELEDTEVVGPTMCPTLDPRVLGCWRARWAIRRQAVT